jgi:hypothetical protein
MMAEPVSKAGRVQAVPSGDGRNGGTGARRGRAIGVIGIPGDRRDDDQREYGAIAATAFDEIIVREDKNLRGRPAGQAATNVIEGVRDARSRGAARTTKAERILEETAAVKMALRRAAPGDLLVCCVDDAIGVYRAAMAAAGGSSRGATAFADPGELEAPEG